MKAIELFLKGNNGQGSQGEYEAYAEGNHKGICGH